MADIYVLVAFVFFLTTAISLSDKKQGYKRFMLINDVGDLTNWSSFFDSFLGFFCNLL